MMYRNIKNPKGLYKSVEKENVGIVYQMQKICDSLLENIKFSIVKLEEISIGVIYEYNKERFYRFDFIKIKDICIKNELSYKIVKTSIDGLSKSFYKYDGSIYDFIKPYINAIKTSDVKTIIPRKSKSIE